MPARLANLHDRATDLDILEMASRRCSEVCAELRYLSELSQISESTKQALLAERDRLDDSVSDLDHEIKQLRVDAETAEYFSEQRSIRRDLATAVEG